MTCKAHNATINDAGISVVSSDDYSLTVGPDGLILPQDHYLIEPMANFNLESIPERQPHVKSSAAFGYFEMTRDTSAYIKAALFQPGTKKRHADSVLNRGRRARRINMSHENGNNRRAEDSIKKQRKIN